MSVFEVRNGILVPRNSMKNPLEEKVASYRPTVIVDAHGNPFYTNDRGRIVSHDRIAKLASFKTNLRIKLENGTLGDILINNKTFEYIDDYGKNVTVDLRRDAKVKMHLTEAIAAIRETAIKNNLDVYDAETDTLKISNEQISDLVRLVHEYAVEHIDRDDNVRAKVAKEMTRVAMSRAYTPRERAVEKVVRMPQEYFQRAHGLGWKGAAAAGVLLALAGCSSTNTENLNVLTGRYAHIWKTEKVSLEGVPGTDKLEDNQNHLGIIYKRNYDDWSYVLDLSGSVSHTGQTEVAGQRAGSLSRKTHRYATNLQHNGKSLIFNLDLAHTGDEIATQDDPLDLGGGNIIFFDEETAKRLGLEYGVEIGQRFLDATDNPTWAYSFSFKRNDDIYRKDYEQWLAGKLLFGDTEEDNIYGIILHRQIDEGEFYSGLEDFSRTYLGVGGQLIYFHRYRPAAGLDARVLIDLDDVLRLGRAEITGFWYFGKKDSNSVRHGIGRIGYAYDNYTIGGSTELRERTEQRLFLEIGGRF